MIVRIKGVKTVKAKGRLYHYHRRSGVSLPGPAGSPAFLLALKAAQDRSSGTSKTSPGSLGGLVTAYRASPEFVRLAPGTARNYRMVLDILAPNASRPLVTITTESLYELRDQLAPVRGRTTVNRLMMVLRVVFGWAIKRGLFKGQNPAVGVDGIRRPHGSRRVNRPWTTEELEVMLAAAHPRLALALTLAAYTGLRVSDVVSVTWAHYDGRRFETITQKTEQRVWIPAHPRLRDTLDRITVADTQGRIVGGTTGGLRASFYKLTRKLGLEGLSIHGLRHTLGHALAEAGCDPPTIAAVLGQSSTRMAEHYSRTARRDHLAAAAFEKLTAGGSGS